MSLNNEHTDILNIIRGKLERERRKILEEGGRITPYNIMESLKAKADEEDNLSCIGRLIQESLGDRKMIDSVGWIAFHFDFPGKDFSYSEGDMRNWVAVKGDSQGLLNEIYKKVQGDFRKLKDHYAPSILFARMSEARSRNAKLGRLFQEFQKRWWLYRFTDVGNDFRSCVSNDPCHAEELKNMEVIFFEEGNSPDGKALNLTFSPPVLNNQSDFTLGDLLDETEDVSLQKFNTFKRAIQQFDEAGLNSDVYVSVPLFFCGSEQEYVTDIYVSLSHARENGKITRVLEINDIMRILNAIIPSLQTCVSLVNSQVAYSLGEVTRKDKMASLLSAVIRHDINNFAAAVDGSISQLLEYWLVMEKERVYTILREVRANLTLYTMSMDLDFIWGANRENLADSLIPLMAIREELDKSWCFSTILGCDFLGDWNEERNVPKICRIVLSNLLRNAINNNDDSRIVMSCRVKPDKTSFACLSEAPISDFWKRQAFEEPLSVKKPSGNLGLWICRHVVKSLKGDFYLGTSQGKYTTNIVFDVPVSD